MAGVSHVLRNKFYFDETYAELIKLFHDTPAKAVNFCDTGIKLAVRTAHGTTECVGRVLRLLQTGNLQIYALIMAAGAALVLYLMLRP
jgi:NADH:ubiquinone oxidoreductase subunit 5 (subunit L)/multisubunit Na+/H+ antiporter MnhA subunit